MNALVVWGGWEGHEPEAVADLFREILEAEGFKVDVSNSLDSFLNASQYSLLLPVVTMGKISPEQVRVVCDAVSSGVGIAGCHGGMCDSFRDCTEWQFLTGGQWVAHPGDDGVRYTVNISDAKHPITQGIADFEVESEQYYMHVDPAVQVLASTRFPIADGPHVGNGEVNMPVVWTKLYGRGRVFYCSLGHKRSVLEMPAARELMRRGLAWANAGDLNPKTG